MNPLLSLFGMVGNVLDTPGALVRNALAGRNPLLGLFAPEERTTGRQLLEQWGLLSGNEEGLDAGDVAGFATEMVADPLNLLGAGWLRHAARGAKEAKAANRASEALRAAGAMPEEVAKLTKIVDEAGNPQRMYHGTTKVYERFDPSRAELGDIRAFYSTHIPEQASDYATAMSSVGNPHVKMHFLDSRSPANLEAPVDFGTAEKIYRSAGRDDMASLVSRLDPSAPSKMTIDDLIYQFTGDTGDDAARILQEAGFDSFTRPSRNEMAVFNPSQVYLPYVAPAMQQVPSMMNPLLAMLGYNASRAF